MLVFLLISNTFPYPPAGAFYVNFKHVVKEKNWVQCGTEEQAREAAVTKARLEGCFVHRIDEDLKSVRVYAPEVQEVM